MGTGGLTYGVVAPFLVGHGFCADDPRLMTLVNKATQALLSELIPVDGMATYDITAVGTTLLLPKELLNAIEVEVLNGASVLGDTDVTQGWYDLVNQFVYVDPSMARDNPLVDQGLVPDISDPTILRRQYDYPGLEPNSVVRVTGAKRYLPITQNSDFLLIQNVRALEEEVNGIQKSNNSEPDLAEKYHASAVKLLTDEVKKYQLDPRNSIKRKGHWEADLANFNDESYGYQRALLAFDLPGGLGMAKSDLSRLLDQAEQRLMNKGLWVGTIEEFSAPVVCGRILAPVTVKSILAATLCGQPLDVRNIFFQYQQNGPGKNDTGTMLIDEGEVYFSGSNQRRRQYRLTGYGGPPDCSSTTTAPVPVPVPTMVGDTLYIGSDARYVSILDGVALETRDDITGIWTRQWEQTS